MNEFHNQIQNLEVSGFQAGQVIPWEVQQQQEADPARLCIGFCVGFCTNCFNCTSCFRCFNCFNCFRCHNCFQCFRCHNCAHCR
ncbi:heterocycloanthracin/sonorensin family bacteriocin [Paenibacillus sp. J2TS4]|uniref:heterocycloanthracin/sonorensin family bacteriocin n=1 Tax=Paenibacillus sp. J2TS4 TaxID=2807194 RepID=UPI001BD09CDC